MAYSVQEIYIKTGDGFKKTDSTNLLTKTSEGWSESNAQELLNSNSVINVVEHNPINAKLIDDTLYTQVDYITTSGSQYFKTGVTSAVNSGFDIDFIMLNGHTSSPYYNLFGSRGTGTVGEFRIDTISRGDGTELKLGSNVYSSGIKGAYRNRIKLYNGVYTKPDGTQLTNLDASTIANYPREIYIGCINKDNSAYGNKASLQIFHWVMYTGTTLERDFWPVKRKSDGVYGLYDVEHGVFYEPQGAAVTGNGENIIPYNQSILTESEKIISGLPNTYRPLEYLESSGKQYILTPFIPNQDTRIDMLVAPLAVQDAGNGVGFLPYGASANYNSRAFECYSHPTGKLEFNYDGQVQTDLGSIAVGTKIKISQNKNVASFYSESGQLIATKTFTYQSFTCPGKLALFGINRSSTVLKGHARIYNCQIYNNGELVYNLVPAASIDTNQFGLFDLVSQSFFINADTHEFIAGPTLLPVVNQEPSINQNYKQLNSIYLSSNDYITILPDTSMLGYTCYLEFGLDSNASFEGYIFGSKSCRLYLRTDVSKSLAYISIEKDTTNYTINLNGSFTKVKITCDDTGTETLYVYTGEGDTGWYKVQEYAPQLSDTAPNGFVLGGWVNGNGIVNTSAPIYISSCDIYKYEIDTSGNITQTTYYIGRPVLEQRTGITGLYNAIDGSIATSKGVTGEGKCWHYPIQLVSNAVIGTLPLGTLIRVADSDGGDGVANYEIADINNLVPGGVVLVRKNIYSNSVFGSNISYPHSTLDNLIGTTIFGGLPQKLRDIMMDVTFKLYNSGNITRKMFALTHTMAGFGGNGGVLEGTRLQLYTSNASRIKTLNGSAAYWWLSSQCTPEYDDAPGAPDMVRNVSADGSPGDIRPSFMLGVVPAFAIPLNTIIDGSSGLLIDNIPTISTKFIGSEA